MYMLDRHFNLYMNSDRCVKGTTQAGTVVLKCSIPTEVRNFTISNTHFTFQLSQTHYITFASNCVTINDI